MENKKVFSIPIATMLIFSLIILVANVSADGLPVVRIEPPSVDKVGDTYCQWNNTEFTVEVKIYNVTDLYSYGLWVGYNSTLLSKTATVVTGLGQVVPSDPSKYVFLDTSVAGTVKVAVAFLGGMGAPSFNGSGTLLWITFKIIYCPSQLVGEDNTVNCTLDIIDAETHIYNHLLEEIAIERPAGDGFYSYTTKGYVPSPAADFIWSPFFIYVGETVTLVDTSDPGPPPAYIVSWKWTITNGTGSVHLTGPDNESMTTFQCDGPGDVFVTLNITLNYPGYWDAITKAIMQYQMIGPTYVLTIYSSPTGVTFTVNGSNEVTPWSGGYSEGTSVSLVMPETHDGYEWSHWLEDGDTNRTKTVTMDTNITLTAVYTPSSAPVGGIYIPVNKLELLAPYIGLTIPLVVAVITLDYFKKRKRDRKIIS